MNIVKQWKDCYCLDTGDSGEVVLRGIIISGLYGVCESGIVVKLLEGM